MAIKMTVFSRRIFSKNFSKKKVKKFSDEGRNFFGFFFWENFFEKMRLENMVILESILIFSSREEK
jgi:hypothetical protein